MSHERAPLAMRTWRYESVLYRHSRGCGDSRMSDGRKIVRRRSATVLRHDARRSQIRMPCDFSMRWNDNRKAEALTEYVSRDASALGETRAATGAPSIITSPGSHRWKGGVRTTAPGSSPLPSPVQLAKLRAPEDPDPGVSARQASSVDISAVLGRRRLVEKRATYICANLQIGPSVFLDEVVASPSVTMRLGFDDVGL